MLSLQTKQYWSPLALLCALAVLMLFTTAIPVPVIYARPTLQHEGDIVINEIIKDPVVVSDDNGEWFEVVNIGTSDVNINGWCIRDDGTNDHTIDNSGNPLIVPAGGYLVLGRNSDQATNGGAPVDYAYGTDIQLANVDDEIILENAACNTGGTEVDRVEYDDGVTWPDPTGASMEFCFGSRTNNDGNNWLDAETTWSGSDGDLGSPGSQNACTEDNEPTAVTLLSFSIISVTSIPFQWRLSLALIILASGISLLILGRRPR